MSDRSVTVGLDESCFEPGETLRGWFRVRAGSDRLKQVEITVGWRTEGKGQEERGVEYRKVHRADDGTLDASGEGMFEASLPAAPLSYDGVLLKILWVVRVRATYSGWRHESAEQPFRLGHVKRVVPGDVT